MAGEWEGESYLTDFADDAGSPEVAGASGVSAQDGHPEMEGQIAPTMTCTVQTEQRSAELSTPTAATTTGALQSPVAATSGAGSSTLFTAAAAARHRMESVRLLGKPLTQGTTDGERVLGQLRASSAGLDDSGVSSGEASNFLHGMGGKGHEHGCASTAGGLGTGTEGSDCRQSAATTSLPPMITASEQGQAAVRQQSSADGGAGHPRELQGAAAQFVRDSVGDGEPATLEQSKQTISTQQQQRVPRGGNERRVPSCGHIGTESPVASAVGVSVRATCGPRTAIDAGRQSGRIDGQLACGQHLQAARQLEATAAPFSSLRAASDVRTEEELSCNCSRSGGEQPSGTNPRDGTHMYDDGYDGSLPNLSRPALADAGVRRPSSTGASGTDLSDIPVSFLECPHGAAPITDWPDLHGYPGLRLCVRQGCICKAIAFRERHLAMLHSPQTPIDITDNLVAVVSGHVEGVPTLVSAAVGSSGAAVHLYAGGDRFSSSAAGGAAGVGQPQAGTTASTFDAAMAATGVFNEGNLVIRDDDVAPRIAISRTTGSDGVPVVRHLALAGLAQTRDDAEYARSVAAEERLRQSISRDAHAAVLAQAREHGDPTVTGARVGEVTPGMLLDQAAQASLIPPQHPTPGDTAAPEVTTAAVERARVSSAAAALFMTRDGSSIMDQPVPPMKLVLGLIGRDWASVASSSGSEYDDDEYADIIVCCAGCGAITDLLVQSATDGAWYCNSVKVEDDECTCIIAHLLKAQQRTVTTHQHSRWGAQTLRCWATGGTDIFTLGVTMFNTERGLVVQRHAARRWPGLAWHPFVSCMNGAPYALARWFLEPHAEAVSPAALVNAVRRQQLHALVPAPVTFDNPRHYQDIFAPLVRSAARHESEQTHASAVFDAPVYWGVGVCNEPVAWFSYTAADPIALDDQLTLKREEDGESHEWEGQVFRMQDGLCGVSITLVAPDDPRGSGELVYTISPAQVMVTNDRQQTAVSDFCKPEPSCGIGLRARILNPGSAPCTFRVSNHPVGGYSVPNLRALNSSQEHAVATALERELTLIAGPPGTGKTTVAAAIVYHFVRQRRGRVLVAAESNNAADRLAEALVPLAAHGVRMLRYFPMRKDEASEDSSLPAAVRLQHYIKDDPACKSWATLLRLNSASARPSQMHRDQLRRQRKKAYKAIIPTIDVLICTCATAGDSLVKASSFSMVLVDEAAQSVEPTTLIPVTRGAEQLVLVGDDMQLSPTVKDRAAQRAGLQISMFHRLRMAGELVVELDTQYRMHPVISRFVRDEFYAHALCDGVVASERVHPQVQFPFAVPGKPALFVHVPRAAPQGGEVAGVHGSSLANAAEATAVVDALSTLVAAGAKDTDVAVISMYEAQRRLVRERAAAHSAKLGRVFVATVDSVQGREYDFVIVTLVRSNAKGEVGFISDRGRANVALSRARYGIIIVGDGETIGTSPLWASLLRSYAEQRLIVTGLLQERQHCTLQVLAQEDAQVNSTLEAFVRVKAQNDVCNVSERLESEFTEKVKLTSERRRRPRKPVDMESSEVRTHVAEACARINAAFSDAQSTADSFAVGEAETWVGAAHRAVSEYLSSYDDGEWSYTCEGEAFIASVHACYAAADVRALESRSVTQVGNAALAAVRLFQFWYRSRWCGRMSSAVAVLYYRLANSKAAYASRQLYALIAEHSFRHNEQLRQAHATHAVVLKPWGDRPALTVHRPRAVFPVFCKTRCAIGGSPLVTPAAPRAIAFRLVRNMRCGYGTRACFHSVQVDGKPLIRDGVIVRRRDMATGADYEAVAFMGACVTGWYRLYCDAVRARVRRGVTRLGFGAPGGLAEANRRVGFDGVLIDNADDLEDPRRHFGTDVFDKEPGSPIITVEHGCALDSDFGRRALAAHPRSQDHIMSADSPPCTDFSTAAAISGHQRPAGAPARRRLGAAGAASEVFNSATARLQERWVSHGVPYLSETTDGNNSEPPPGGSYTINNAMQFGVRSRDRRKWYHAVDCPLPTEQTLIVKGLDLEQRSCAGASRPLPPLHPYGAPVKPFCCHGETVAFYGRGTFVYGVERLNNILGLYKTHVKRVKRLHDVVPVPQGAHAIAAMSMYVAQTRFNAFVVTYDQALADLRLGAWVMRSLADTAFVCPQSVAVTLVCLPAGHSGRVVACGVAGRLTLPTVALPTRVHHYGTSMRGTLLGSASAALMEAYPGLHAPTERLRFAGDLLRMAEAPRLVFVMDTLPCNDSAHMRRARAQQHDGSWWATVDGSGGERVEGLVHTDSVEAMSTMLSAADKAAVILALRRLNPEHPLAHEDEHFTPEMQYYRDTQSAIVATQQDIEAVHSRLHHGPMVAEARPLPDASVQVLRALEEPGPTQLRDMFTDIPELASYNSNVDGSRRCLTAADVPGRESLQAEYAAICKKLGIHYDPTAKVRADLGGGSPKPIVIDLVGAVLTVGQRVLTVASSTLQQSLFFGPRQAASDPMKRLEADKRSLEYALEPYFAGHAIGSHLRGAIRDAVEDGNAFEIQWVQHSRSAAGYGKSNSVPGHKFVASVVLIKLQSNIDWTTAASDLFMRVSAADSPSKLKLRAPRYNEHGVTVLASLSCNEHGALVNSPRLHAPLEGGTPPWRPVMVYQWADCNELARHFLHTDRSQSVQAIAALMGQSLTFSDEIQQMLSTAADSALAQDDCSEDETEGEVAMATLCPAGVPPTIGHSGFRGRDYSGRPWILLYFERPYLELMIQRLKTLESRAFRGIYRMVQEGWLLCCQHTSASPAVWFEVERRYLHTSPTAMVRAHRHKVLPNFDVDHMSDEQIEYAFYQLHSQSLVKKLGTHEAAMREWQRRLAPPVHPTDDGYRYVAWQVTAVPGSSLLPGQDTRVTHELGHVKATEEATNVAAPLEEHKAAAGRSEQERGDKSADLTTSVEEQAAPAVAATQEAQRMQSARTKVLSTPPQKISPHAELTFHIGAAGASVVQIEVGGKIKVHNNRKMDSASFLESIPTSSIVCALTDCTFDKPTGLAARLAESFPHSSCCYSSNAAQHGVSLQTEWRAPGTTRTFSTHSEPTVAHLHCRWRAGAASHSRNVAPQGDTSALSAARGLIRAPAADSVKARAQWFSQALHELRACPAFVTGVTVYFNYRSLTDPEVAELRAFARANSNVHFALVQSAGESQARLVAATHKEIAKVTKEAKSFIRQQCKEGDASPMSQLLSHAYCDAVAAQLQENFDNQRSGSVRDVFAAAITDGVESMEEGARMVYEAAQKEQRRFHEKIDSDFRNRILAHMKDKTVTKDAVCATAEAQAAHVVARAAEAAPLPSATSFTAAPDATGQTEQSPTATQDAPTIRPRSAKVKTRVRVGSALRKHKPCRLVGISMISEASHQVQNKEVKDNINDTGSAITILGKTLRDLLATQLRGAIRSVDPLPSSVRRIRGVVSAVSVREWVAFTLEIGGCLIDFDDVPVLDTISGLILGEDFAHQACVTTRHNHPDDKPYDGSVVLHNSMGEPISDAVPFENTAASTPVMLASATESMEPPALAPLMHDDYAGATIVDSRTTVSADGHVKLRLHAVTSKELDERIDAQELLKTVEATGFAPQATRVEGWSQSHIRLRLPSCVPEGVTVALLPLDDKDEPDLGVLLAPSLNTVSKGGYVWARVLNINKHASSIPLLRRMCRFIIDPVLRAADTEYTSEEIMQNINVGPQSTEGRSACKRMLRRRRPIFRSKLGYTHVMPHRIVTRGDPYAAVNRVRPPSEEKILDEMVVNLHKQDIIEPACSPWNSLPMVLAKPDGSNRPAIDLRGVNMRSDKDSYKLPNVDANIAALGDSDWFTTIDLLQGFLQVELTEDSKPVTAFTVKGRQWQFKRMPMGLTSSPGAFMRVVDAALRGLPPGIAFAYV